jgi:hypothetical protein
MLPQALLITCGNRRSGFDLNATDITTLLNNNIHLHFVFIASLLRLYCVFIAKVIKIQMIILPIGVFSQLLVNNRFHHLTE